MATSSNKFRLKLYPSTYYNYTIYWGDGTSDFIEETTSPIEISASISHTYPTSGVYSISAYENVYGGFPGVYFNGFATSESENDSVKVIAVDNWGSRIKTLYKSFDSCKNLNTIGGDSVKQLSGILDCGLAFRGTIAQYSSLTSVGYLNTQSATSINGMFMYAMNLSSFPNFDTSNVIDFSYAFQSVNKPKTIPTYNTSNGKTFQSTWLNCTGLTAFPLIDTSNATSLNGTWWACTSLTSFPLIDTSKNIDFTRTWLSCEALTGIPPINTSSGTLFASTFRQCTRLSSVPLINTSKATDINYMFADSKNITTVQFTSLTSVVLASNAFYNCPLSSFSFWDMPNATDLSYTWAYNKLSAIPMLYFPKATLMNNTFYGSAITYMEGLSAPKVTDFSYCFAQCTKLSAFPKIYTPVAQNLNLTWGGCINLLDFPEMDLPEATAASNTWSGCTSLTSFGMLTAAKNLTFEYAWSSCIRLTTFPKISAPKVTNWTSTWSICRALTSFPDINFESGTNFTSTWSNCISLSASNFDPPKMPKMTNGTNAFLGVTLHTQTYSAMLTSLSASNINTGVTFSGGNSKYNSTATAARTHLVAAKGWTITDGGPE